MKIRIENLTKSFGSTRALDDVSIEIDPGQLVAVVGRNGAGKTTLLRCMAGLLVPDAGRILYDGETLARDRLDVRRRFCFLPDVPSVFPEMSVVRHIGMALRLYDRLRPGIEDEVAAILREYDLLGTAEIPFSRLSRGAIAKGTIAALVAVDPELWLVDEPFASGIDPLAIRAFKKHARDAIARGRTVMYSTQLAEIAESFSDRVCILHEGRVHAFEPTADVRAAAERGTGLVDRLWTELRGDQ